LIQKVDCKAKKHHVKFDKHCREMQHLLKKGGAVPVEARCASLHEACMLNPGADHGPQWENRQKMFNFKVPT
jgi:hypothetical protein